MGYFDLDCKIFDSRKESYHGLSINGQLFDNSASPYLKNYCWLKLTATHYLLHSSLLFASIRSNDSKSEMPAVKEEDEVKKEKEKEDEHGDERTIARLHTK